MTLRHSLLLLATVCLVNTPTQAAGPNGRHTGSQTAQTAKPAPPDAKQPAQPAPQDAKPVERKEIKVAENVLKTYVGVYELTPDRTLEITLEGGSLWGQPSGQDKRQLFAEAPTKFFLKAADIQLAFQKDAKGVVTGLLMDQAGRPQRELKKVK